MTTNWKKVTDKGTYNAYPAYAGTKLELVYLSHKDSCKPNASSKTIGFYSTIEEVEEKVAKIERFSKQFRNKYLS